MVFGGIDTSASSSTRHTLWAGGPYDPNNPEALAALPEARRLTSRASTARPQLIGSKMMARPLRQMPYQTVGDLLS